MQIIIYNIINKLFMNEVESDLLNLIKEEKKIIFDVGCFRGNFTKNLINKEKKKLSK